MNKQMILITLALGTLLGVAACNGGTTTNTNTVYEQPAPQCSFGGTPRVLVQAPEISARVANGCAPTESSLITQLVVSLSSTSNPESALKATFCTGTPIADGNWILTAAHCVVDASKMPTGGWQPSDIEDPANIFLWQGQNLANPINGPIAVTAVYIHNGYDISNIKSSTPPADIALLKVSTSFPLTASLNTNSNLTEYTQFWLTGYGATQYKYPTGGLLNYRQSYYITNLSPYASGQPNVGELYTTGSIPVDNYAWKFVGPGDSGGGDFLYQNGQFVEIGIHSWSLLNAGTYGSIPSVYGVDTAVAEYTTWINSVVNGTPTNYVVRN